ncbi:PilN domain-containing protein [Litorilituus lipolyticus]|uniref:MSHA biogenesis protein MshI n=1 Tax=Litorilituus lipolyticus TaxID=2491017 RepID=A0A502L4G4_9GAMM|nr:PilN domain-containing protein [Litorilituus lipolyticus]TPH17809.1 hypothetical protein EPA86_04480 [Litorilituus lipolyticus]
MQGKHSINLLQAELLPEKVLLTLPRVVMLWGALLLAMVIWAFVTHSSNKQLKSTYSVLQKQSNKQSQQVNTLEKKIANRAPDKQLQDKLATLNLLMRHKQGLHGKLTDTKRTFVVGFAKAMQELSQMHHPDIRLTQININLDDMTFSGLAKKPEAVPAWLAGFEDSVLLSGKSFVQFELTRNEANMTEFTVSSKYAAEDSK